MIKKVKRKLVSVLFSLGLTACGTNAPSEQEYGTLIFQDHFTDEQLHDYIVNNPDAIPGVTTQSGRYYAPIMDNEKDKTLHFNQFQGRLDARKVSFPFTIIVRNIGIETLDNPEAMPTHHKDTYIFAGVQIHSLDLQSRTSSHVVVGHRGEQYNTVEGKNTFEGYSWVTDVGANKAANGKADILIQGLEDHSLKVFWQVPNPQVGVLKDRWLPYNAHGKLPGDQPKYDDQVYVGLITYAQGSSGLPFAGTADSFSVYKPNQ